MKMDDIEENAVAEQIIKKKRRTYDGTNLKDYIKCNSWSYRRWAWAFLCRNSEFIKACEEVVNGDDEEKAKVAKRFGLIKFKYYMDVQSKKDGFPAFNDSAIKCWENIDNELITKEIPIYPGQVVIRFMLASEINSRQALGAQITKAKNTLNKRLIEFEKYLDQRIGKRGPKATSFIEYLRILDMQAHGIKKPEEIARYLYQVKPQSKEEENIDSFIRSTRRKMSSANKHAETIYRYIALRSGTPK